MCAHQISVLEPARPGDLSTPANGQDRAFHLTLIRHSLGWLSAANLVGVGLAADLVWPRLGELLSPLSYGRWMPLHTDWQLYGWCALPLVGLLSLWLPSPDRRHAAIARGSIFLWSAALALGGISWLAGRASGKLFLSATGSPRFALPAAFVMLWSCLAANLWHQRREVRIGGLIARVGLLAILCPVPVLLWLAGEVRTYPSVNPDSGGATGASLLASTLVVVAIVGWLPWALNLKRLSGPSRIWEFAAYLLCAFVVFMVNDQGNVSHHRPAAIGSLAVLLASIPILPRYLNSFIWNPAPNWRFALIGWWTLLVVTGFASFLPGLSERLKFTNALVAHAHVAMAGFATALSFIILQALSSGSLRHAFEQKRAFYTWQLGNVVSVGALLVLGWREGEGRGILFRADPATTALYAIRLLAGACMTFASCWWFYRSIKQSEFPR